MKVKFVKRAIEPQTIQVAGNEYPAILSYDALATLEEYTEIPFAYSLARITMDAPTTKDIVGFLLGVMQAADVEVTAEDLLSSLEMGDSDELLEIMKKLIAEQGPEEPGKKKPLQKK